MLRQTSQCTSARFPAQSSAQLPILFPPSASRLLRQCSTVPTSPNPSPFPGLYSQTRTHRRCEGGAVVHVVRALSAAGSAGDGGGAQQADEQSDTLLRFSNAFYKFSRPHTMAGTSISVTSISLLALQSCSGSIVTLGTPVALNALFIALTSALLMNVAIVGLNQLSDVEIDKINKPDLPLASGEMSMQTGTNTVIACTILSLGIGLVWGTPALMATLLGSLALGVVYSVELPFLRWKRSPFLAALCILVVRALAVQLGFYYHMATSLGSTHLPLTPPVIFTVSFMLLFSIVIALFKDLPDAKGDRTAGVRTLTVQLGVPRVFWAAIWVLTAAYAGAVLYSLTVALSATTAAAPLLGSEALLSTSSSHSALAAESVGDKLLSWGQSLLSPLSSSLSSFSPGPAVASAAVSATSSAAHLAPASLSLASAGTMSSSLAGSGLGASIPALPLALRTGACVAGHIAGAVLLWQRALSVNLNKKSEITGAYMFIWKLFYAEYLLIPFLL